MSKQLIYRLLAVAVIFAALSVILIVMGQPEFGAGAWVICALVALAVIIGPGYRP